MHRDDQAPEPFFLGSNGVIILNPNIENQDDLPFYYFREKNNAALQILIQSTEKEFGTNCYVLSYIKVKLENSNIIHRCPNTIYDLADLFPKENILEKVSQTLTHAFNVRKNERRYYTLFSQNWNNLSSCRFGIIFDIPLKIKERKSCDFKVFIAESAFGQVLADFGVLREFNGKKQKYEFITGENHKGKNIKLSMFEPQLDFNTSLAQWLNNVDKLEPNSIDIVMVGTGALGSSMFEYLIRAGFGKWKLIDNDILLPHNLARHTLTHSSIGEYKASELSIHAKEINPDIEVIPFTKNIFTDDDNMLNAIRNSSLIIDASASAAIERHIALDMNCDARKVSCFLNPRGTATIFLMEDNQGNCRLDLLEMQYYRTLTKNDEYKAHLIPPEDMAYAPTCRSISSQLAQDSIALSAAICCKAIKAGLNDHNAKLVIWNTNAEKITTDSIEPELWDTRYSVIDKSWRIELNQSLYDTIVKHRHASFPKETGGILIGSYDNSRKMLYLVDQIESPCDSISSPTSYIRGCDGVKEKLDKIESITQGNLCYVGEWHSHPFNDTEQSDDDKVLMQAILDYTRDRCQPACMLIIGEDKDALSFYIGI